MPTSPPEIYTVVCLIMGEDTPFSIKIPNDEIADVLKDKMKEKRQKAFVNTDANELTLYHVEIVDDINLVQNAKERMGESPSPLRVTNVLADIFKGTPKGGMVHILVQSPKPAGTATATAPTSPTSLPNTMPSPTLDDAQIEELIAEFKPDLQAAIGAYLHNDVQLPLWQPQGGSGEIRRHISGLKVPAMSASSQSPSLLLHKLGEPSHDLRLAERVNKLFHPGFNQRFLCNTSGSGKTRLLLEGLWHLEVTLRLLEEYRRLTTLGEENRHVTSRRFLLVLYVRLLIFGVFLGCASTMPGGITEHHKTRWLLIQLAPKTLLGGQDVFAELTQLLQSASLPYLESSVQRERSSVQRRLRTKLFCVLDEAQVPANMFSDCFLSETKPTKPRPILRQIIFQWSLAFPRLIVSGTGVSMREVETVLGSAVAKESGPRPETVTDLGAFDDEGDQQSYLEQYLPPSLLNTPSGKALASRMEYWLHGRYRFTANFLSRLIQTHFESPHSVFDNFVHDMTGFWPSDMGDIFDDGPLTGPGAKLEKPRGFDFSKLEKDGALFRRIAGFVFDYIFKGKPRDLGGPECERLVEYGFARFVNLKNIEADEPSALLAAMDYFENETSWSLREFLLEGLCNPDESSRGVAFEPFGAHLLALAFRTPTNLSSVFDFVGNHALKDEVGQLVAIHRTDEEFVCSPFDISSDQRPSYTLGHTSRTEGETLSWLQDPNRTVFCFPAKTIGPDLIFLLRLLNGSLVRVLVQFKQITVDTIGEKYTTEAIRTTDPKQFISRRSPRSTQATTSSPNSTNRSIRDSDMQQRLQDALRHLGTGTDKAGTFSVLRVLASYPAKPNLIGLAKVAKEDESRHPVATVNMASIAEHASDQQILRSLKLRVAQAGKRQKRKPDGDAEVSNARRRRMDA